MISLLLLIVLLLILGGGVWGWPVIAGILGVSSVTNKPAALQHIRQLMTTYDITPGEVETAFLAPAADSAKARHKGDIAKTVFVYLGAIFILAGITTYIGMFWQTMGSTMRVLVTLGVGYTLLIALISALYEDKYPRAIIPLTVASVVMMVGGWFVLIEEVFPDGDNWRAATLFVCGTMAVHFGGMLAKYQRTVFVFVTLFFIYGFLQVGLDMLGVSFAITGIVMGASLFLVATELEKTRHRVLAELAFLIGAAWLNSGLFDVIATATAANWASLLIGVSLMLTAYGMHRADRYPRLIGLGYLVGSVMFYSALFDLVQDTSVELIFLAITAAVLYACVVLQSRALLVNTVLAMLGYIGYFSAEHFSDSLGWPITLVLMGVAFLGVGTLALRLRRKI